LESLRLGVDLISTNCPEVLSSAGKALFIDAAFLVAAPTSSPSATARTGNSQQSVLKKRLVDTNWSNGEDQDQDQEVRDGQQQNSSPSKSKKPARVGAADADSANPPDSTSVRIQKNSAIGSRCLEIDIADVRYRKDTRPLVRISGICDLFIFVYILWYFFTCKKFVVSLNF
jgi:hypothetical protein